jgi:PAS domain S-box-containing protein
MDKEKTDSMARLRRAQQELQLARDRYADLFEFAPVGYFTLDRHFLIVQANLTASRLLNAERGKLAGMRFSAFVAKEHQDVLYRFFRNPGEKSRQSCELKMTRPDGTPFHAELRILEKPGVDDNEVFRVSVSDISERKRAEDTSQRRAMLDASAVAYCTMSGPVKELIGTIRNCIRQTPS